mmetsp:Transcript_16944/g.28690  ORF Transcript_16944/g.28690 Transcript_16944/m.28690 type:complete len:98 (-) Transcript_16944:57-350(-)
MTVQEALETKMEMMSETLSEDLDDSTKDKISEKLSRLEKISDLLADFTDFINEARWNRRFEVPLAVFLEMCVDQNLRKFLGMELREEVEELDKFKVD